MNIEEQTKILIEGADYKGTVWLDPVTQRVLKGSVGTYEGGMVLETDITNLKATVVMKEVLGLAHKKYNLRNILQVVRMNELRMRIASGTQLTADEKVAELKEATITKSTISKTDFDLWKNVVHIVVSDEAKAKSSVDIFNLQVRAAAGALAKSENDQIATEAETATAVGGSDWVPSTNNPYEDIATVMTTIEGYGVEPNFIAAHPLVWGDFFGNTAVKGTARGTEFPGGKIFTVPGLPGMTGIWDSGLTNTVAIVGSKESALVLGEGPTSAAQYRNEPKGYTAYIIRQWLQPEIVFAGGIRKLTGVHA